MALENDIKLQNEFGFLNDIKPDTLGYDVEHWEIQGALLDGLIDIKGNTIVSCRDNVHRGVVTCPYCEKEFTIR